MSARTLLRGGCVLTLGHRTQNLSVGDVLVEGDRIAEVGAGLRSRDAEVVDATDTIVMPGFVDAHRHAWRSLFRNQGTGAVPAVRMGPDDVYAAVLIGLLGAAEAGVTTVVDWFDADADAGAGADGATAPGLAEAALRAHADSGLRTVFVHVASEGQGEDAVRAAVDRLRDGAGPSTTVAVGIPRIDAASVAGAWAAAREAGAPIFVHLAAPSAGAVAALAGQGSLGPDVTFVHRPALDDADLDAIASAGASVALAPSSEMASGLGSPPIQPLVDRGIRLALGVDDERIAPGDLFAQMRATISVQHATVFDLKLAGKAGLPKLMNTRDVIRYGTSDGAAAAGVGTVAGSIEPGRQADLIVLRTDRPNIFPINDPIGAVVWGMDTSNLDRVDVGGRAVMRDGALVADVERARALAAEARDRVAGTAGSRVDAPQGAGR